MLESSAKVNGVILPIIALSLPLAQTLAALNVPQAFVESMTSITDSHVALTLIMIGILILAGCFMETTPNILILSPILLPLAREIGMDDIQFCIMMVTSLGVGFITPTRFEPLCRIRTDRDFSTENRSTIRTIRTINANRRTYVGIYS